MKNWIKSNSIFYIILRKSEPKMLVATHAACSITNHLILVTYIMILIDQRCQEFLVGSS